MHRLLKLAVLAASCPLVFSATALGQGSGGSQFKPHEDTEGPPPARSGRAFTEADKCRNTCAQEQATCMTPCAAAPGATDPKNQSATMACVSKCSEKSAPCLEKCDRLEAAKASKKGKKSK